MPVLGVTFSLGLFVEYSPVVLGYIHVCVNGLTVSIILARIIFSFYVRHIFHRIAPQRFATL